MNNDDEPTTRKLLYCPKCGDPGGLKADPESENGISCPSCGVVFSLESLLEAQTERVEAMIQTAVIFAEQQRDVIFIIADSCIALKENEQAQVLEKTALGLQDNINLLRAMVARVE